MAESEVQICSDALGVLGLDAITSLNDDTKRARVCKRQYPRVRDAILRAHPWNCATFRQVLAQSAATPAFGYSYAHTLPTDPACLRALATDLDREEGGAGDEWRLEIVNGLRVLVADVSPVRLRFTGRITDPTLFD